jgi:hypothetical protein
MDGGMYTTLLRPAARLRQFGYRIVEPEGGWRQACSVAAGWRPALDRRAVVER